MADIVERLRDSDTTRRIGESYADVHDRRQADRDEAADEITRLRAEVSELNSMFDARWSADMRAIECWRKVNPGNELVLPDHVDLCLWLMEERTRLTAENEKLRAALERLLRAKNEKDAHGDTPVYQALKAGAWDEARAALEEK